MNADFDLHFNLYTLAGVVGICATAFLTSRRRAKSAPEDVDADRSAPDAYPGPERRAPLLNPEAAPKPAGDKAPRRLLESGAFLDAVDAAIPASLQQSRSVGLLYVRCAVECPDPMMRAAALNIAADAILKAFRPSDPIARVKSGDLAVALPMLADRRHIAAIEARVQRVADETALAIGFPIGAMIGSAMYPINGYSARALVASAREAMRLDRVDANGQRVRIKPKSSVGEPALAEA